MIPPPYPGHDKLALPHAEAGGLGGVLLLIVGVRISPKGDGPALAYQPGAQVDLA